MTQTSAPARDGAASVSDPLGPAADDVATTPPAAQRGLRRIAAISASLVGTYAVTSVLGLLFWLLAARVFPLSSVGVGGAAVALMTVLGALGTIGMGTLLIDRLPHTAQPERRVLVRTALALAGVVGTALAGVVAVVASLLIGIDGLDPITGSVPDAALLAVGTGLMAVALVVDQAVLVIGSGSLQLERNAVASGVKLLALGGLALSGHTSGMDLFSAWTLGTLVSLPLVAWRTRGGRALEGANRLLDLSRLRGLGRTALSHHALNTSLQATLQILPLIVLVGVSSEQNGVFTTVLQVTGAVFLLPYAISIALFASAAGNVDDVIERMHFTVPVSLGISLLANLLLFPLAPYVLGVFGSDFSSQGVGILRVLALAGLAFVVKDHYVALRRVEGRTGAATRVMVVMTVVELAAAYVGVLVGSTLGLSVAWVTVLVLEAAVLAVPLTRAVRARAGQATRGAEPDDAPAVPVAFAAEPATVGVVEVAATAEVTEVVDVAASDAAVSDAAVSDPALSGPAPEELPATRVRNALSARFPFLAAGATVTTTDPEARTQPGPRPVVEPEPLPVPRTAPDLAVVHRVPQVPPAPVLALTRSVRQYVAPRRGARLARLVGAGPLATVMALGLVPMSLAVSGARDGGSSGTDQALWVLGLVLVFAPAAFGAFWPGLRDSTRLVLAVTMAVLLQISRLVLFPTRFMFHDELVHATVLDNIVQTGRLFGANSLLPVTSYYPGLETATDAVHALSGLPTHTSAAVVLLLARVVLALSVLLLVTRLTGSVRIGAGALVVYSCNPQMLFFNSQFSYQTLALPLAVLTVYLVVSRRRGSRLSLVPAMVSAVAVAWSHHVTTVLLVLAFAVWWLVELLVSRRRDGSARAAGVLAVTTGVAFAGTLLNPGNPLGVYLGAIADSSAQSLDEVLTGGPTRTPFQNSAGVSTQPYEKWLLLAGVLLTLAVLLPALWRSRVLLRTREGLVVVLILVGLLYPIIPGGHVTVTTAEVGDRSSGFVFLGVGFLVAWWAWQHRLTWWKVVPLALGATVVFLGSVILGAGSVANQLPGPFRVSDDARSIDADNIAAADWMRENLPAHSTVFADRVGGLLASAYGGQTVIRHVGSNVDASRLLLDPQLTAADRRLIRDNDIRYLVSDRRDSFGLPNQGVYIENGEFGQADRTRPVPIEALRKFSTVPGVDVVYDNGSIVIYDLEALDARQ